MSDVSQGAGWWRASDEKWYPPETHPDYTLPPVQVVPVPVQVPEAVPFVATAAPIATYAPGPPMVPMTPVQDKRTYASPMSFVGITRRTTAWVRNTSTSSGTAVAAWTAACLFLMVMYPFLLLYYFVVFVLFGIFTIPYRLARRSQRKSLHVQQNQLAAMQGMMIQQQYAMGQPQPTAGQPGAPWPGDHNPPG